jgi:hypothetical protein
LLRLFTRRLAASSVPAFAIIRSRGLVAGGVGSSVASFAIIPSLGLVAGGGVSSVASIAISRSLGVRIPGLVFAVVSSVTCGGGRIGFAIIGHGELQKKAREETMDRPETKIRDCY